MEQRDILKTVDHTLLAPDSTWEQIRVLCDDAIHWGTASVCIPAAFVARAKKYVGESMRICTVIGFPNGYSTTETKVFETEDAVRSGADEIDMVIRIGWAKEGAWDQILEEIRRIRAACPGKVLKVIVETCLLTDEEKIRLCQLVSESGADYIKTSTGFSSGGATFSDVELFAAHVKNGLRIKAAGGISSLEDAEKFLKLGADRLGTSRVVRLFKEKEANKKSLGSKE